MTRQQMSSKVLTRTQSLKKDSTRSEDTGKGAIHSPKNRGVGIMRDTSSSFTRRMEVRQKKTEKVQEERRRRFSAKPRNEPMEDELRSEPMEEPEPLSPQSFKEEVHRFKPFPRCPLLKTETSMSFETAKQSLKVQPLSIPIMNEAFLRNPRLNISSPRISAQPSPRIEFKPLLLSNFNHRFPCTTMRRSLVSSQSEQMEAPPEMPQQSPRNMSKKSPRAITLIEQSPRSLHHSSPRSRSLSPRAESSWAQKAVCSSPKNYLRKGNGDADRLSTLREIPPRLQPSRKNVYQRLYTSRDKVATPRRSTGLSGYVPSSGCMTSWSTKSPRLHGMMPQGPGPVIQEVFSTSEVAVQTSARPSAREISWKNDAPPAEISSEMVNTMLPFLPDSRPPSPNTRGHGARGFTSTEIVSDLINTGSPEKSSASFHPILGGSPANTSRAFRVPHVSSSPTDTERVVVTKRRYRLEWVLLEDDVDCSPEKKEVISPTNVNAPVSFSSGETAEQKEFISQTSVPVSSSSGDASVEQTSDVSQILSPDGHLAPVHLQKMRFKMQK